MSVPKQRIDSFARDGLTFDVRDEGPLDGPVVVLLHGFPERSTSWREVAPLLHARGLRTVAPDQRGYSPGARPPRRRDYRIQHLVADVAELIGEVQRTAPGPVHLVGHDWGAVVGWMVAAQHPALLRTWTAVSVPHPRAYGEAMLGPQALRSTYIGFFQLPFLPELSARPGGPFERSLRRFGMTEDEVERFRAEMVADGALGPALNWYRAIPFSADRSMLDPTITVPTTFVWSDRDPAIDRKGAERTGRYVEADYTFVELDGVTHWIPTQAPDELAAAVLDRIGEAGPA
ncbi:alpha/beta fold hydrolase [Nocardioides ferulae]|uniref:alpha/beta fold hydrolase n=1 Tax=Nocardioides ferulae TaxID=2340821 RepID=UPI000EB1D5E3|nr:alpha/beta fold hydrolase [Nocardioides ferulae]